MQMFEGNPSKSQRSSSENREEPEAESVKTFGNQFQRFKGPAHIKAIEAIGTRSLLNSQKLQPTLSTQLSQYAKRVIALQQIFDVDSVDSENFDINQLLEQLVSFHQKQLSIPEILSLEP
jgi:hypothetical protein